MILVDYSGIAIAAVTVSPDQVTEADGSLSENLLRHFILNTIRMYNKKFRDKYGQMILCCDQRSWRKEYYPLYKYKRSVAKEEAKTDPNALNWDEFFQISNKILEEIRDNFPYYVLSVEGAEADDIIAVLAQSTQEFGSHDEVMIVSSDKDMLQLQRYQNVRQFSPRTKKFLQEKDPYNYLLEHIFKGDAGDGVPNVLSPDNTFKDSIRQSPITQKKLSLWKENANELYDVMNDDIYRNYQRNKTLIDLTQIPDVIKSRIMETYEAYKPAPKMKIFNYLVKKRCKLLIESISDFSVN